MSDSHTLLVSVQLPAPVPVQESPGAATVPHTDRKQAMDSLDTTNTKPSAFFTILRGTQEGETLKFIRRVLLIITFRFCHDDHN